MAFYIRQASDARSLSNTSGEVWRGAMSMLGLSG